MFSLERFEGEEQFEFSILALREQHSHVHNFFLDRFELACVRGGGGERCARILLSRFLNRSASRSASSNASFDRVQRRLGLLDCPQ